MKKNNSRLFILGAAFAGMQMLISVASAQTVLFSDDFETNSASRWAVFGGGNNNVTNDYIVQFNFDYSTNLYGTAAKIHSIPVAPNSTGGTRKGVKVTANKNRASGTRIAGVSLYPSGVNASGNYSLRFDMFMVYNGDGSGGGGGSTEMSTFGINHLGTKVNWFSSLASFSGASWPGDGTWFWITGEGGTGTSVGDIRAFKGDPTPGPPTFVTSGNVQNYHPGDILNIDIQWDINNSPDDAYGQTMAQAMPAPPGETPGAPGKQWVQAEIRQQGGYVTWLMNGFVIWSHNDTGSFTSGTAMLGYCDPISGVPNVSGTPLLTESYTIYDNVKIVDLGSSQVTPTVTLTASTPSATKPGTDSSQYGVFTFARQDGFGSPINPATPLTVYYTITGTASNGVDYALISTNVTIPSGASSTNLNIIPSSLIGDPTATVNLKLVRPAGVYSYELRHASVNAPNTGTVTISDPRGVPAVNVQASKTVAYEGYRPGQFNLIAAASYPTNVTINLSLTGSATNGVNYLTIPSSVTLPAGSTNVLVDVSAINNSIVEASNRTVILTVAPGNGYRVGNTSNATVTIRNDDLAFSSLLFSDVLDTDSSANWNVNKSESSDLVTFAYDYNATDGIPSAPGNTGGTTLGVKLQANVTAGVRNGISLSPKGGNFTNNYRLSFDFWLNYNGDDSLGIASSGGEATMWFGTGVGTTGDHPVWDSTNSLQDAIWFDANNDGSSFFLEDFEAFKGSNSLGGVWVGNSPSAANPYYAEFGRVTAPQKQTDFFAQQTGVSPGGTLSFAWHKMTIEKVGTNVTWSIDGLPIAIVNTSGITLSTNVLITYYDPADPVNPFPELSFAVIDNVRVESLTVTPPTTPSISSVQVVGGNIQINFSGGTSDAPGAFTLESKALVTGTFGTTAGASITQLAPGSFRATAPLNGPARFYRIKR